ncbi:glycoside hydrolase family 78 protein [Niabella terrae]
MTTRKFKQLLIFGLLIGHSPIGAQTAGILGLQTEHLTRPLGIDQPHPRFSWQIATDQAAFQPQRYRLLLGTDSAAIAGGQADTWTYESNDASRQLVAYAGPALRPFTTYFWTVRVTDGTARHLQSAVARFETGMLGRHNWQGAWISDHQDIAYRPAPYFRKEFSIEKKIASARAYIAAAGLVELSINGRKIGNHVLDPVYTNYDKRVSYLSFDVGSALQQGGNAVGVLLGNGWYNHQSLAVWDFHKAPWRARPTFCMDLRIRYMDGTTQVIRSERDWKTAAGPLIANSIYTGEQYDARKEMYGWNLPGFDDSKWEGVRYRQAPAPEITSQQMVPIRQVQAFDAVAVNRINDSIWVFDMGQNMSGVTRVSVKGPAGTRLKIRQGERLHADGRLDLSNIDVYFRGDKTLDPFQTDILILSGRQDEFTARFNYKGFRYVEIVSSIPMSWSRDQVRSFFVHSDVEPVGSIESSSPLINKLWKASNYSYLSNLMGYPTDCPQREKNGWTGDGHLAIETGLYNFDGITVYEKWLRDHRDEQQPNGVLPDIIPTGGWGYGTANGLDWTSTIAIIPWELYLFYGDLRPLKDNYTSIKAYVDYVDRISPEGLTSFGRGDWVPVKTTSNLELTSSIYFYVDADILARTAQLLGKTADFEHYDALRRKIKSAINSKYLHTDKGIYGSGTQTELSMALHWKIVPEHLIAQVAAQLNERVKSTDFHLDVGVLGAKALLNALNDNGYPETAYKVAVQDSYPSWGWWIVNGATTLLENWDLKATRDISDNHMMFGEIGGWFFKGIGGIRTDEKAPGFKHIRLQPHFPKDLQYFTASHRGPYGNIVSSWKRKGRKITYEAVIPPNSTATVDFAGQQGLVTDQQGRHLASDQPLLLSAGRHIFTIQ